jgi:hypothetical protein
LANGEPFDKNTLDAVCVKNKMRTTATTLRPAMGEMLISDEAVKVITKRKANSKANFIE